ncbi:hypothetical protein MHM84_21300 [Halomonas sp. McH1-25]|uniref:hypothetical protein n=1 Tax=unclassified Halomonas TaxID=2609666 RepID=UPI001EF4F61C|nr:MULTISPECIES: hypothetical protein [unclassified Halomonas]MCG7602274.1 hypothetical protein [Halomonas sp. McH1-25]MCP1344701.1 hypothetical protein [Halomonas sp. FL8]MCP1363287.1 hypothetical protein [Halomonas sp. BBD45]MCP1364017.1 hypothetical protein [Halomonas sp. BBD48]
MPYSYKYKPLSSSVKNGQMPHMAGFIIFNTRTKEEGAICFESEVEAKLTCLELNLKEQGMSDKHH